MTLALAADGLRHSTNRGIFHTASNVCISGYDMSFACKREQRALLPEMLCPVTASLTEVVLNVLDCLCTGVRGRSHDARSLALVLQKLISAREAEFVFELTGIADATERP